MEKKPAGFWKRVIASLLDTFIIGIPLTLISYFITGSWEENQFTMVIDGLYYLVVPVIWMGYTIGKKIVGIRIVKVNGGKLGFSAMFLRTFVAGLVYVATLGIGLIASVLMVGLRKDKRAIHDFIAGTYVTFEKR